MGLTVNGEAVPDAALAAEAQSLLARFQQLPEEQRRQYGFTDETMRQRAAEWARENVIERTLMRQAAFEDQSPIPDDVFEQAVENMYKRFGGKEKFAESGLAEEDVRREAEAGIRVDRLVGSIAGKVKDPKTKEAAEFYRKHKEQFEDGETIRAAHIVKHVNEEVTQEQAREAIDALKAELDAGAAFEELADRASDCPGNGGDLGWFGRGKMVERFDAIVFELEPGEVSRIFKTEFGYHIAKLHERKPATLKPLAAVRDQIDKVLRQQKETKALEEFVDRLKEKADIQQSAPTEATVGT